MGLSHEQFSESYAGCPSGGYAHRSASQILEFPAEFTLPIPPPPEPQTPPPPLILPIAHGKVRSLSSKVR
jgi:hypothetical protein